MEASLVYESGMRFVGSNENGLQTAFDASVAHGGAGSAASPMEVLLQSVAACSAIDIVSIITKKRKTITNFRVAMEADRAADHPKVFTRIHLRYVLTSPDASEADLTQAVELSQATYCSAIAMMKHSGCAVSYAQELVRP
jgi:putative redox protein